MQEQDGTCVDVNVDEAGFKIVVDVVVDIGLTWYPWGDLSSLSWLTSTTKASSESTVPLQGAKVKDVVRLQTVRHVTPAVKLATKLQMRRRNLCSQLRLTLSETFGHDIVNQTVTIG